MGLHNIVLARNEYYYLSLKKASLVAITCVIESVGTTKAWEALIFYAIIKLNFPLDKREAS